MKPLSAEWASRSGISARCRAEKIVSLIDLVPCWDVELCLAVQVEQQWDRELEGNGTYDVAALTPGIPYCDVVVTE